MKYLQYFLVFLVLSISANSNAQSDKKIAEIKADSKEAKAAFLKKDPDLATFFSSAYGYAIFPNVGKGGLGVGAASGHGIVFQKGAEIGTAKLSQVSIGLQAGGQAYREVVFFEKKADMDRFKGNKLEFSAQLSAVAAAAGASLDAKYIDGVAVFTTQKGGLMYEASVGGQKFKYESF